ncbi:MAG: PAS domain-containing protein [Anaerolineales bacterium]|nr:PAS domain-containing protein [Anaerolineales bacterium]
MSRSKLELVLKLVNVFLFLVGIGATLFILNSPVLQDWAITAFVVLVGVLLSLGAGFNYFFRTYILGSTQLAEQITLISMANPAHRVPLEEAAGLRQLTLAINTFAERFQTVLGDQESKILQARAALEEEKNRLVALMSELTEGVLVCNVEGRILLYNNRARQMLGQVSVHSPKNGAGGFVGLGRSVFGLIDRTPIMHALEELSYRSEKQNTNLVSHFVTTATNGQLIRVHIASVLDQHKEISGFILTLEDITRQSQASNRRDILLKSLTEGIRASLASIRAAIETIEEYPEMDAVKLNQLKKIIYDESLNLSTRVNQTTTEYAEDIKAGWQLEEMLSSDLLWAIQRRFEDKLGIYTRVDVNEENLWLKVDSYSVVQAMTYIMRQLQTEAGVKEVTFRLKGAGRLAALDLMWSGSAIDMDTLWAWQNQSLIAEGEGSPLTLREVAERHGSEAWCQTDKTTNMAYYRLLLPTTQPRPTRSVPIIESSRPEYYDFDLFHQPGQKPELDDRPLSELTYTVFDTETTGMNPSGGDEIISISAVRIVNGRLLRQEIFDQLVDPKRILSRESIAVHGILPEMLKGQPTIEQVLPQFQRFAEDTVLVGHNAAFDMRLLQLKEIQTGIKFINPVLDTLLLSAVIHPNQESHSLEAIAQRLGIKIIGRHTSLGDAILTGEIFLKLISLLAERGIVTHKAARHAAQQTYYARLSY